MSKAHIIGLTGSIGMGKSTTAMIFATHGIAVWSADDAVHRMYAAGGAAVDQVAKLCPEAIVDGGVDRRALTRAIKKSPDLLGRLEKVVHPLVARDRSAFLASATTDIVLFDVPLLFETGIDADVDTTVVVTVSQVEQRRRVLERPGMTDEKLELILAKQMPDAEKRKRADFVVETHSIQSARDSVAEIVKEIRSSL